MLNYSAQLARLDPVFHALADGARRAMLARLSDGPASVSELAAPLPMSLPAVMQHLKVLEGCGLVSSRKQGRTRICEIQPVPLQAAGDWIAARRAFWDDALGRLGAHLHRETGALPAPKEEE